MISKTSVHQRYINTQLIEEFGEFIFASNFLKLNDILHENGSFLNHSKKQFINNSEEFLNQIKKNKWITHYEIKNIALIENSGSEVLEFRTTNSLPIIVELENRKVKKQQTISDEIIDQNSTLYRFSFQFKESKIFNIKFVSQVVDNLQRQKFESFN